MHIFFRVAAVVRLFTLIIRICITKLGLDTPVIVVAIIFPKAARFTWPTNSVVKSFYFIIKAFRH